MTARLVLLNLIFCATTALVLTQLSPQYPINPIAPCTMCKNVDYVKELLVDRLTGVWYLLAVYLPIQVQNHCIQLELDKLNCTSSVGEVSLQNATTKQIDNFSAQLTITDPTKKDGQIIFEVDYRKYKDNSNLGKRKKTL